MSNGAKQFHSVKKLEYSSIDSKSEINLLYSNGEAPPDLPLHSFKFSHTVPQSLRYTMINFN